MLVAYHVGERIIPVFAYVVGALPAGQRRLVLRPQRWRPTHAKEQAIMSAWRAKMDAFDAFVDVCDVKVRHKAQQVVSSTWYVITQE